MKLKNEMPEMIKRFGTIADKIQPYAEQIKLAGDYKDLTVRVGWDCLRAVYSPDEICSFYSDYDCNDGHITTAVKIALKEYWKE